MVMELSSSKDYDPPLIFLVRDLNKRHHSHVPYFHDCYWENGYIALTILAVYLSVIPHFNANEKRHTFAPHVTSVFDSGLKWVNGQILTKILMTYTSQKDNH